MRLPFLRRSACAALTIACSCAAIAQTPAQPTTATVLMLSDIHLDPLHDPGKYPDLVAAPASDWEAILAGKPSTNPPISFDDLQSQCNAKGIDTPYALLASSLSAEQKQLKQDKLTPAFVTISGDLTVHHLDCRLRILAGLYPKITPPTYGDFAARLVQFVELELHSAFPSTPAYFSLGNNDSGCGDYEESAKDPYLATTATTFSDAVLSQDNKNYILADFPDLGDYHVDLPAPFTNTRLIVLQDIYQSIQFNNCPHSGTGTEAADQIKWLKSELGKAQAKGLHVWVMAHIPPGVDPYSTSSKGNVCTDGHQVSLFQGTDNLGDALSGYTGTVSLVLLAHTHMDELRLYASPTGTAHGAIPVRFTPSITPVDGNYPSFTIATVDPSVAVLLNYSVYVALDKSGAATTFKKEYDFKSAYGYSRFSAASITDLTGKFLADPTGKSSETTNYETYYSAKPPANASTAINKGKGKSKTWADRWPMYPCAMTNYDPGAYTTCACSNTTKTQ